MKKNSANNALKYRGVGDIFLKPRVCVCIFISFFTVGCASPYRALEDKQSGLGYFESKLSESRYLVLVRTQKISGLTRNKSAMDMWEKRIRDLCNGAIVDKGVYRAEEMYALPGNSPKVEVEGFVECQN